MSPKAVPTHCFLPTQLLDHGITASFMAA
jgi:hypothetical protein